MINYLIVALLSSSIPLSVFAAPTGPLDGGKYVVAHHMVGLTAAYKVADWEADIKEATANGIDGFALNVGKDDYTTPQADNAFAAAANVNKDFKLFFSLDMAVIPCGGAGDLGFPVDLVKRYAKKPNYLVYRGDPYVSTFAGENCKFGAGGDADGALNAAWSTFKDQIGFKIHFAPSFFIDPARFKNLPVMDGGFNFNGGFSNNLKMDSDAGLKSAAQKDATAAMKSDEAYIGGLGDKSYMTGVSPWFFTHFSQKTWNKNWVYLMDNNAFTSRWQQLLEMKDKVDMIQIVTWNDYGESHYIGPIRGAVPEEAKAWVDGFDHQGFLPIVKHFATAFKTGKEPPIGKDLIVLQGRPHPKGAKGSDPVGIPTSADLLSDSFFATVFAASPAKVTLASGAGDEKTVDVPAGVSKLSHPLAGGGTMKAKLERDGKAAVDLTAAGFTFNPNPEKINFNVWVAASK